MKNGNALVNALNKQGNTNQSHHNYKASYNSTGLAQQQYRYQYQNNYNNNQSLQQVPQYKSQYTQSQMQLSGWPLHSKIILGFTQAVFFALALWYFCTVHFVDAMHPILIYLPLIMIIFSIITEPAIFNYDRGKNLESDSWGLLIIMIVAVVLNYLCYQL